MGLGNNNPNPISNQIRNVPTTVSNQKTTQFG